MEQETSRREPQVTQSGALALIVARRGRLSDGWRALLLAAPEIGDVRQAHDASSALDLLEALGPELVLLDVELLGDDSWTLLGQLKAADPKVHCIALISNIQEQQEALAAAADAVLMKGFHADRLAKAIAPMIAGHDRSSK